MTDTLLGQVLRALDVAVIERMPESRFEILGAAPGWLETAFDEAPAGARHVLSGALPFLDGFLPQAEKVWHHRGTARADSGLFVATIKGEEALLRATALTLDERSLLLIERLTGEADTRPILQTARERILEAEHLTRRAAGVHDPAATIHRLATELADADLSAAHRALVDALRAASADLQAVADALPKPQPKSRRFAK